MCFCNTYQYLMRKEISGSLFRETPPLYFGAPFVFQLWVMLSKDECYNQYPMKNSALYLYPPSHLSQTVIPTKNICYSYEKAVFYDTRPPIIAQGHDGRFLVLGMYTMYLSFAFTFLLVVGLVSGAAFYALPFLSMPPFSPASLLYVFILEKSLLFAPSSAAFHS